MTSQPPDDRVTEYRGILAVKFPGVEERHPVDVVDQRCEVDAVEYLHAGGPRPRRHVGTPVDLEAALARLVER